MLTRPTWNPARAAEVCYDKSQQLYDLVSKVLVQIAADNPSIIPPPVPGTFPPPVTDGSPAAPGTVGEVISRSFSVNLPNVPATGASFANQFPSSLQPGDWELSYLLLVSGGQVLTASCQLDTSSGLTVASVPGNMLSYAIATAAAFSGPATLPALPLWCPPVPFSNRAPALLMFRIGAWSGIGTTVPSTPVQFYGWARRMR